MSSTNEAKTWTFLTNHAQVLLCLAATPDIRLRDVAERVGITERSTQRILSELVEGGDAEPLDPDLLRERFRPRSDPRTKLRRLDEHRVAAAREDLALEPFVVAV